MVNTVLSRLQVIIPILSRPPVKQSQLLSVSVRKLRLRWVKYFPEGHTVKGKEQNQI